MLHLSNQIGAMGF
jgi:DNA-directed RNA polymerase II subunit RPB3